jgi:hypothetical protein
VTVETLPADKLGYNLVLKTEAQLVAVQEDAVRLSEQSGGALEVVRLTVDEADQNKTLLLMLYQLSTLE